MKGRAPWFWSRVTKIMGNYHVSSCQRLSPGERDTHDGARFWVAQKVWMIDLCFTTEPNLTVDRH